MSVARVVAVAPGSPAAAVGLVPGDELLALNGESIRDVIRYQFQADEPRVEIELRRGGLETTVVVDKPAGAGLGLELDSAVFDRVRTCDNHCPFCFIHQLPEGMRKSLSLKDDDYRLSFLYGNFTTLTRFTEADLERVVSERLSPLYVSIHATDPQVRTRLLRNRRGATSLRWLRAILDAGIEVHGQVVVCPGINDGAVLDDTLFGIFDRFAEIATVGVVPLGVSAHNREPEMRPHQTNEATRVLDIVDAWQERFLDVRGERCVFASDEYYLLAGRPFPSIEFYEGARQHENGIGMASTFAAELDAAIDGREHLAGSGPKSGFFAWVDGARPDGYRVPTDVTATPISLGTRRDAAVTLLTGAFGAPVLAPHVERLAAVAGVAVDVRVVENGFFGGNIGVTGLLTGADLAAALVDAPEDRRYLLPDVALSRGRFLDGTTIDDLPRAVEVVGTSAPELVTALRRASRSTP
jgi:putative radical SAM enzyme (TIGR03279 family)